MQTQIHEARRLLDGVQAELCLLRNGQAHLLVGGVEGATDRALKALDAVQIRLAEAQDAARQAGAEIVRAVRRAGCAPRPEPTCCAESTPPAGVSAASVFDGLLAGSTPGNGR